MILGFSGTWQGMTSRQRETVQKLFRDLPLTVLHHGDCIGADAQAHRLALDLFAQIVIHPPEDEKKRAFCGGFDAVLPPYPYLTRNRNIVVSGHDGLVAAPFQKLIVHRSGTWSTVRYAREAGRRIWLVHRDGTLEKENQ